MIKESRQEEALFIGWDAILTCIKKFLQEMTYIPC